MREEYKQLIEDCKALIFKNGTWEQVQTVYHVGELVMCEQALPEHVQNAFYAALADILAEVYEETLKWMSRTERSLIEDQIASAVWLQVVCDSRRQP